MAKDLTNNVKRFSKQNGVRLLIAFMLIGAFLIIVLGPKSHHLDVLFFLLVVIAALYTSIDKVFIIVGVVSAFTLVAFIHGTLPFAWEQWGVQTVAYLILGLAVHHEVKNVRKIEQYNKEMEAISDISTSLTKTLDLTKLTHQVVDHIFSLFQPDGCTIYLLQEDKVGLKPVAAKEGREDRDILERILRDTTQVGLGLVGWVALTGEALLLGDAEHDERALHIEGTPFDDESVIGVPLQADGEIFGVLWIYKLCLNAFSDEEVKLATIFASQVSVALANARLYEHVRLLSETDSLTGLLNARSLQCQTERAITEANASGDSVSFLFLDCDNFKTVNDCFGHPVGDQFLRFLACILRQTVRERDIIIRYAGDEFVIILPNTDLGAGKLVGERVVTAIARQSMDGVSGLRTSVSMGLAVYPLHADNTEELIKFADNALYVAKRNGKNQLAVYEPSQAE